MKKIEAASGLVGTPIGDTGKLLYFGTARLCDLENEFDLPFGRIMDRVAADVDVRTIRTCLSYGLAEHHDTMKPADVDALLSEAGVADAAKAVVAEMSATVGGLKARQKAKE